MKIRSHLDSFIFSQGIYKLTDRILESQIFYQREEGTEPEKKGEQSVCSHFIISETLSQLAALHVKYLHHFTKHSFLVGIKNFDLRNSYFFKEGGLCYYKLHIVGSTTEHYLYQGEFYWKQEKLGGGLLTIATKEFDDSFKQDILGPHYQKIFKAATAS